MSEIKGGIERIVGVGDLLVFGVVEVMDNRYTRLSRVLEGLSIGHDEEYLSLLTVGQEGPGIVVDLTVFPRREDLSPGYIIGHETSTRTIINTNWGDGGLSKPFITANQFEKRKGEITGMGDYRCDRPFYMNSLRLGSVLRVAKLARDIQRRQRG